MPNNRIAWFMDLDRSPILVRVARLGERDADCTGLRPGGGRRPIPPVNGHAPIGGRSRLTLPSRNLLGFVTKLDLV
jgi:hypothetical protein